MKLQVKTKQNLIQIGHIFRIIRRGYYIWWIGKNQRIIKSYQPDIDKIYLYAKDRYESKYQILIKKRENAGIKHYNDPKAFMEYSKAMNDNMTITLIIIIQAETERLIFFQSTVKELLQLFIRCRKLNNLLYSSHNLIFLCQKTSD